MVEIKKIKRYIFFVFLLNLSNVFSEEWHRFGKFEVKYSPDGFYSYDYVFEEQEKLKTNSILDFEWFPAFGVQEAQYGFNNAKRQNKTFIFGVRYNNDEIFFDLTKLITKDINYCYDEYASFLIHENNNSLDLVIAKSNSNFYLIRFDFLDKSARVINKITINPVYFNFYKQNCYNFLLGNYTQIKFYTNENDDYNPKILNEECKYFYCYKNNVLTLDNSRTLYNEKLLFGQKKLDTNSIKENSAQYLFPKNKDYYDVTYSYITDCLTNDISYTSNSELIEGQTVYAVSNLATFSDIPWVPAEKDLSKEEIVINSKDKIIALMIGNGFYNTGKEYLFLQNRRAKELSIEYENNPGFEHHVILMDTAFAQPVPLVDINSKTIKIKILSYYNGSKYDDLCINYIGVIKYDYQKIFNRMNEK